MRNKIENMETKVIPLKVLELDLQFNLRFMFYHVFRELSNLC